MGLYQSFSQVFVTNSSALLAQGKTVDSLAVGQIGILDAKTYKAVTAPTYATNKALYAVWGTPDVNMGDFGGVPNENEYSKIIKGKYITKFRAKKAQRGQTPLYSLGWSGDVSDTDSLTVKPGQSKNVYVKLTGKVIDRLYGTQGVTKLFKTTPPPAEACAADCVSLNCFGGANELADQINNDKDFKKFVKVKAQIECDPALTPTTVPCYKYCLTVCDAGDAAAFGAVQVALATENETGILTVTGRANGKTTYCVITDTIPDEDGGEEDIAPFADFSQTDVFVAGCTSCPVGYTYAAKAKVFEVRTQEGVSAGTVNGIFTGETSTTLISSGPQFNVYYVTFATTAVDATVIAAGVAAGYDTKLVGIQSGLCTLTTPVTTAWSIDDSVTLLKQEKDYRITLSDSVCGTTRLAELQAAYPSLTIALVDAAGSCVHTYETTVLSNCYLSGCGVDEIKFEAPAGFEGAVWQPVVVLPVADATCKCGLIFETAFFNVKTTECSYNAFPYENDVVYIQVSDYDPDFNASPDDTSWVFKQLREVKYPQGHGAYIQRLEQESKAYDQRFRMYDPVVREAQGYVLQADPSKFYDQYVLEFSTKFKTSGGWAQDESQSFHLNFFVPEGQGNAIETAFNTYLTSAGIEEEGAVV